MKNEYHYTISRTDRICLVIFCCMLLSWEFIKYAWPEPVYDYQYVPEPEAEEKKTYEKTTYNRKPYTKYPQRNFSKKKFEKEKELLPPPAAPILIHKATVEDFRSMGFKSHVAYNMAKYLQSGGKIYSEKDLYKIFGMDSSQVRRALPHLLFELSPPEKDASKHFSKKENNSKPNILNINVATLEDLDALPGIGPVLAERIVKFRTTLGGFHNVHQLKDCYGITPEAFDKFSAIISAEGDYKKILLNKVDPSGIQHPYLSKKHARLIEAYIDQHGPILDKEELKKIYPVDTSWVIKLLPYLDFDPG